MTMCASRNDRSVDCPPGSRHRNVGRCGFSLLEFEVALLVLGIALTGLFPLVVMHSRGLEFLERRCAVQGEWYLAPAKDAWARKLGAAASLTKADPGPLPTPPEWLVDDGDAGHSDTGSAWVCELNPQAFQGDHRRCSIPPAKKGHGKTNPPPSSTDIATWTFTNVTPGWYYVQATWLGSSDQTTGALYAIHDGSSLLDEATMSQQIAPAGPIYEGRPWQILATEYFKSGTVQVQLSGQAAGYLVADGMRLVPVENEVQVLSLERTLDSEEVTAHVLVNVLVPQ